MPSVPPAAIEPYAMVMTLPVLYPLVVAMGFNPIWFGVILLHRRHGRLHRYPVFRNRNRHVAAPKHERRKNECIQS